MFAMLFKRECYVFSSSSFKEEDMSHGLSIVQQEQE